MYRLEHTVRHYAWGSRTAFAQLFDTEPSTQPEAELWFGTHPADPSYLADGRCLNELVELPYLLKVLAAEKPLSIQAHPCPSQARAGFERENALGLDLDHPERSYKDANHKPELLLALTDFSAMCGFRAWEDSQRSWQRLIELSSSYLQGEHAAGAARVLHEVNYALDTQDYAAAVHAILGERAASSALTSALEQAAEANPDFVSHDLALETALQISRAFPADPGVLMALLLHRIDLVPGQAIYLSAGIIHAYLHGVGVEVMACSDNVLRGGLTDKHIDVDELVAVSCFEPSTDPLLSPTKVNEHVSTFAPDVSEFQLQTFRGGQRQTLTQPGPHIVLCISGTITVGAGSEELTLQPGQAVYIPAEDTEPHISFHPEDNESQESPLAVSVTSGQSGL